MSNRERQRLVDRLPFPPYTSRDRHYPRKHFRGCILFGDKPQSVALGSVLIRYAEIYDEGIYVPWWFAPNIPVLQTRFGEEIAVSRLRAIENGKTLDHLKDPGLRFVTELWVGVGAAAHSLALTDDVGTLYSRTNEAGGGGGDTRKLSRIVGSRWFTPSLAEAALRLEVSMLGAVFEAELVPD